MIPNIGPVEILIVLGVVLAVFGTKRLPELGSSLGRGINSFRKGIDGREEDQSAAVPVAESQPDEAPRRVDS